MESHPRSYYFWRRFFIALAVFAALAIGCRIAGPLLITNDAPSPEEKRQAMLDDLAESVATRDLPGVPHQYTLSAGHYELRRDLPAGNCTLRWLSGFGNVGGDVYDGTIFEKMGDPSLHADTVTEIPDVRLSVGMLSVYGDLVLSLEYENVNFETGTVPCVSEDYIELSAGTYSPDEIGGAFQEFDLEAVSGSGSVTGGSLDASGIRERMSANPGDGEISAFRGFALWVGEELTITGDLVVRLYPYIY